MKFSHFFLGLLVVIAVPIIIILQGYDWQINQWNNYHFLEYVTESGSGLWSIGTCALLTLIIAFYTRKNWRLGLAIIAYTGAAILITQGVKSVVKDYLKEPRPYITQISTSLAQNGTYNEVFQDMNAAWYLSQGKNAENQPVIFICEECLNDTDWKDNISKIEDSYYNLTPTQRKFFTKYIADNSIISPPYAVADLVNYYEKVENLSKDEAEQKAVTEYELLQNDINSQINNLIPETSYSTPSGHSMFASVWMFVFILLAFNSRKYSFSFIALAVVCWGCLVQASRIMLGYHYAYDVLFSAIFVAVYFTFTFWTVLVAVKILYKIFPVKNPGGKHKVNPQSESAE